MRKPAIAANGLMSSQLVDFLDKWPKPFHDKLPFICFLLGISFLQSTERRIDYLFRRDAGARAHLPSVYWFSDLAKAKHAHQSWLKSGPLEVDYWKCSYSRAVSYLRWFPRSHRFCQRYSCLRSPGNSGPSGGPSHGTRTASSRCLRAQWVGRWSEKLSTGFSRYDIKLIVWTPPS